MALLGSATLMTPPTPYSAGSYSPFGGVLFGTATLMSMTGGSSFTPVRFLNVGGVATPVQ